MSEMALVRIENAFERVKAHDVLHVTLASEPRHDTGFGEHVGAVERPLVDELSGPRREQFSEIVVRARTEFARHSPQPKRACRG